MCHSFSTMSHVIAATPFQSFMLGAGHATEVGIWTRSFPMPTRRTSSGVLNSAGRRVWREDGPTHGRCLWEMHGVWGWDRNKNEGVVLRESYFIKDPMTNKKVSSDLLPARSLHADYAQDRLVYRLLLPVPSKMGCSSQRGIKSE